MLRVFFALLLLLAYAYGRHSSDKKSSPKHNKRHANEPEAIASEQYKSHEYHHREDEKVFWKRSIYGTIITLLVAVGALAVAWLTFDDAHEALLAVQRAFVYPADITYRLMPQKMPDNSVGWGVAPLWENSGNTPVSSLRVSTACAIDVSLDRVDNLVDLKKAVPENRVVGPHQKVEGQTCSFYMDAIKSLIADKKYIGFIFSANYHDVFGKSHVTMGCRKGMVIGSAAPDNITVPIELGTVACPTMNCADEQCQK